jgi:hypothetical protein
VAERPIRSRGRATLSETTDLISGLVELDDAADGYRLAMAYYRGEVGEQFASARVARETGGSTDMYPVNAAAGPVNAVTDRLTIQAVTALHDDGSPYPEADAVLQREVWELNGLGKQIPRLIRNTGIYGDSYLYLWPTTDDAQHPVRVAYNCPLSTRVIYDPEDDSQPLRAVKRWRGTNGADNANLITAGEVIRYVRDTDRKKPEAWRDPEAWIETAREEHDLGRLPVEHFATDLPYGRPEHKDAYGPQNAVSKLSPTMVDSAESAGYPSRYTITAPDASLRGDRADELDFADDDEQDLTTDNRPSKLKVGPGEIAQLEGVTAAGQWAAATSGTFIDAGNWFLRVMAQTTTTPLHMLDPGGSVPSGESRRIADAPLEVKVKLRRGMYGVGLESVLSAALRVLGYEAVVRVKWAPSPVADDTLTWQVATAKIAAGVPAEVALVETGLYDLDTVRSWWDTDTEDQGMGIGRRISLLNEFAGAVSQLGQGVSLGLMSDEQAQAVVQQTIGALIPDLPDSEPGDLSPEPRDGEP